MNRIPTPLLVALMPALFLTAYAETSQLPSDPALVYVRVAATERMGRPVTGLRKEEFKVSEDNSPQDIAYFSGETLPLHVAILLDASGAIKDDVKARALAGLTSANARDDELFVVEPGNTPLNDAVLQTLNTLAQRGNDKKRALVLFTSRSDPDRYSFSKVRDRLKELDIQLYVTALPERSDVSNDSGRQTLRDLAELSGGNSFFPSSMIQLENVYRTIGIELRNQYLIGYRSTNGATDGKWRKIKITAEHRDEVRKKVTQMNVRTKPGYYAATAAK